jgi:hypothetical protein
MFGCLGRLGCLALLLVVGAAAWLFRDAWYPRVFDRGGERVSVATAVWQPVTPEAAASGRRKIERMGTDGGPATVALEPAEVAGYVLEEATRGLATDGAEAAVTGDRVYVRAALRLRELGGDALGPFAEMLGERDSVLLGGTLEVLGPGRGQFRVAEVRVRDLALPGAVVPRLLSRLRGAAAPPGLADDALALPVPDGVGDVRVARGQVTLYREERP